MIVNRQSKKNFPTTPFFDPVKPKYFGKNSKYYPNTSYVDDSYINKCPTFISDVKACGVLPSGQMFPCPKETVANPTWEQSTIATRYDMFWYFIL